MASEYKVVISGTYGRNGTVYTDVIYKIGKSVREMEEIGLRQAKQKWPERVGYCNHSARAQIVPTAAQISRNPNAKLVKVEQRRQRRAVRKASAAKVRDRNIWALFLMGGIIVITLVMFIMC